MFENLLDGVRNLSDHWAVVIGVSLVFFVVQAILSMKLFAQAWEQDRLLRQLRRQWEQGESGRPPDHVPIDGFGWLEWILAAFPSEEGRQGANFSRDTALHELDTRIANDWSYLMLQRMGVMAPLLGVVLTVVGFYWLKVDEASEQSLQTILGAVTPLIAGVGAGAVLALMNQFLLQAVGGRLERLRMTARSWFDAVIWPTAASEDVARPSSAVKIEQMTELLAGAARVHAENALQVSASTKSLQHAARQFEHVVAGVLQEMHSLPASLAGIRSATAASAEALQELSPAVARAVANLDVSVAAFRTTIDEQFADAARRHHAASKSLESSVAHIASFAGALETRTDQWSGAAAGAADALFRIDHSLTAAATALVDASHRVRSVVEADLSPSQSTLHAASSTLAASADKLASFIEHGLQPAAHDLAALHQQLAGLQATLESIQRFSASRDDVDALTTTLSKAAAVADAIAALPDQVREIIEQTAAQEVGFALDRGRSAWLCNRPR